MMTDFVVRPPFERVSRRHVLAVNTGDKRIHASASD